MSFYNVANPNRFGVVPPVLMGQTGFLKSGFQQPESGLTTSDVQGTNVTLTAEQAVGRYIVRSELDGPSADEFPSAETLVSVLNSNQWVRATAAEVSPILIKAGFYFDLTIVNNGNATITLSPGAGDVLGFTGSAIIAAGSASVFRIQIINPAEGAEAVFIHMLTTDGVPVGVINPFAGSTAPTGYLLCNGSAVSRTEYSSLFDVVGTTYGVGDGSTTFNLPDLRGKIPVGQLNASAYFNPLGQAGGATDITLTVGQMPTHNHTGTTDSAGAHTHTGTTDSAGTHSHTQTTVNDDFNNSGVYPNYSRPSYAQYDSAGSITWTNTIDSNGAHTHPFTTASAGAHTHTFTSNNTGDSESHSNVQPYLTVNYIIKF